MRALTPVPAESGVAEIEPSAPVRPVTAPHRGADRSVLLLAVVLAVLAAAVAGGVLSVLELTRSPAAATGTEGGREVPLSFGTAVIGTPQVVDALPAAAMKGMTHETSAGDGSRRLVVPVTLVNEQDTPVAYSPGAFLLTPGAAKPVAAQDNPLLTGTLRPGAAVSLRLGFTVPVGATAGALTLDPTRPDQAVEIALPAAAPSAPAPGDPTAEPAPPAPGPHTRH